MEEEVDLDLLGFCVYVELDADLLDVERENFGPALLRMECVCSEAVLRVRLSEVGHVRPREDTDVDVNLPRSGWSEWLFVLPAPILTV